MPDIPRNAFSEEIEGFLAWLELEKGLSQNTIESYENDLAQCALFLKKRRWRAGLQYYRIISPLGRRP